MNTVELDKVFDRLHVAYKRHTTCACGYAVIYEWVADADIPEIARPYLPLRYEGPGVVPPRENLALFRVTHFGDCDWAFGPKPKPWYRQLLNYAKKGGTDDQSE
jgi:hypothetical protein